ncbi:MAG: hypothetical protein J7L46_00175 [Bacteroidales bacterium]|nr:hypothetical protein [Bacteroidales bacterium]
MKKKIIIIPVFLLLLITLFSCDGIYENGKELATDVNKFVPQISVDSLKAKIERGDEFLLIDVQQPNEYNSGNIDIASLIPRGELEFQILNDVFWEEQFMYAPKKEDEIVIYSQKGNRGALATQALIQIGFKNVKNLTGGFNAFDPNHEAGSEPEEEGGCGG